jgi:hypothetical protein
MLHFMPSVRAKINPESFRTQPFGLRPSGFGFQAKGLAAMFGAGLYDGQTRRERHAGRQIAPDRMHKKQIGQLLKSR